MYEVAKFENKIKIAMTFTINN